MTRLGHAVATMNYPYTLDMEATNYNLVDLVSGDEGPGWGGNCQRPSPTTPGAGTDCGAGRGPGHSPRRPRQLPWGL